MRKIILLQMDPLDARIRFNDFLIGKEFYQEDEESCILKFVNDEDAVGLAKLYEEEGGGDEYKFISKFGITMCIGFKGKVII